MLGSIAAAAHQSRIAGFIVGAIVTVVWLTNGNGDKLATTPSGLMMARLNSGEELPVISAGFWQVTPSEATAMTPMAFAVGFSHLDTSCIGYGNEKEVGEQLGARERSSFFLTSKLDPPTGTGWPPDVAYDKARAQLDYCKEAHQVEYFDLMLYHYPEILVGGDDAAARCKTMQEQWRAMEDFQMAGFAKSIGVSNFCPSSFGCLLETARVTPAVNQILYHVGMGADPGGIKRYLDAKGIRLQAYSALGAGTTGKPRTPELITGDLVTSIGAKYGKSGAQVSLRWVVQHDAMLAVESTSAAHLKADLDVFDWSLSDEDMAALDAATSPTGAYSFMCRE